MSTPQTSPQAVEARRLVGWPFGSRARVSVLERASIGWYDRADVLGLDCLINRSQPRTNSEHEKRW